MAIYSGFSHWKWWFSIVMLVYQRVHLYYIRNWKNLTIITLYIYIHVYQHRYYGFVWKWRYTYPHFKWMIIKNNKKRVGLPADIAADTAHFQAHPKSNRLYGGGSKPIFIPSITSYKPINFSGMNISSYQLFWGSRTGKPGFTICTTDEKKRPHFDDESCGKPNEIWSKYHR